MCTVTYIPIKQAGDFVLTSNRDELAFRPTTSPRIFILNETNVGFPKDEKAGGSWIAANNKGRLCCLLNGAFEEHEKKAHHSQSRGNILIEVISTHKNPEKYFTEKDLSKVEPFTVISIEKKGNQINHFSEFVWDGAEKHFRILDAGKPQIWSSVTLYSTENRKMRKHWFDRFLAQQNGTLSPDKILDFHSGTHTNDNSVNLVMEREGGLKTVSITQVVPEKKKFRMRYFDLHNNQNSEIVI